MPSFNTRRSFRQSARKRPDVKDLPPVTIEGFLERKQELQAGGRRATVRSWKSFYTVLCGQLLCFFKDQQDFFDNKAASQPILIQRAHCEAARDYTKKKYVIRLVTNDGSELLFDAGTEDNQRMWMDHFITQAQAPPSSSSDRRTSSSSAGTTGSLDRHSMPPPMPEPVYENVNPKAQTLQDHGRSANNDHHREMSLQYNHKPQQYGDDESDSSIHKEKKGVFGRLLGRKHKPV